MVCAYLYSQGAKAWKNDVSLMRFLPGRDAYMLGDDLLVAPMVKPGTKRTVRFPAGRWREWLNESRIHEGPGKKALDVPLDRFPVFVREGAIVPLDVRDATTGHGDDFCGGHLTICVYPVSGQTNRFDRYEERGPGTRISWCAEPDPLVLESSPTRRKLIWRIRREGKVSRVVEAFGSSPTRVDTTNDLLTGPRTWTTTPGGVTWVRIANAEKGVRLRLELVAADCLGPHPGLQCAGRVVP